MNCNKYFLSIILGVFCFVFAANLGCESEEGALYQVDWDNVEVVDISELEVLATYGKLPEIPASRQENEWLEALLGVVDAAAPEIDTYTANGPVAWYGICLDNRINVAISENMSVDETFFAGVYRIFDEEAKKQGIDEVPVVFVKNDPGKLVGVLGGIEEEGGVRESSDIGAGEPLDAGKPAAAGESGNSSGNGTGIQSIPGFGLPGGLIICLSVLFMLKRT